MKYKYYLILVSLVVRLIDNYTIITICVYKVQNLKRKAYSPRWNCYLEQKYILKVLLS